MLGFGSGSEDSRVIFYSFFFLSELKVQDDHEGCACARWLLGTNQRWPESGVRWVEANQLHLAWQRTDFPREGWRQVSCGGLRLN